MREPLVIELPSSKSISNRLLVFKHLYFPGLGISGLSEAADTQRMHALLQSGVLHEHIHVADAGTVARFITAMAVLDGQSHRISGTDRMHQRPMQDLIEALRSLGAHITCEGREGHLPLRIQPAPLKGTSIDLDTSQSSQFLSAMMMIGPAIPGGLRIRLKGRKSSWPYVVMTAKLMHQLGLECRLGEEEIIVGRGEKAPTRPMHLEVERDWSAAAFFWVAASLKKDSAPLFFPGLSDPERSLQGDSVLAAWSLWLGVRYQVQKEGILLEKTGHAGSEIAAQLFDFEDCPDLALPLIMGGCALGKEFKVKGVHSLDLKESRRMEVLIKTMQACGVECSQTEASTFHFNATNFRLPDQKEWNSFGDHRVAMGLGVLRLLGPVAIDDEACVKKSFPAFWEELEKLGGKEVRG